MDSQLHTNLFARAIFVLLLLMHVAADVEWKVQPRASRISQSTEKIISTTSGKRRLQAELDLSNTTSTFAGKGNYVAWAEQFNGWVQLNDMAINDNGLDTHVYICGNYKQTVTFGHKPEYSRTSRGSYDAFIGKVSTMGTWELVWTVGSTWSDSANGVTVHGQHAFLSLYVPLDESCPTNPELGVPCQDVYLGNSNVSQTLTSGSLVVKIDTETEEMSWAAASSASTEPQTITVYPNGDVLAIGHIIETGKATFGRGNASVVLDFGTCSSKGMCVYAQKLSGETGQLLWATKVVEAPDYGRTKKLTRVHLRSKDDDAIIVGVFSVVATFGGGYRTILTTGTSVYGDFYITKISSEGTFKFVRYTASDKGGAVSYDFALNADDDAFVVGAYEGTTTFAKSSEILSTGTNAVEHAFIMKINTDGSGDTKFAFNMVESSYASEASSIGADVTGNFVILGHWFRTATISGKELESAGSHDAFALKVNNQGSGIWVEHIVTGVDDIQTVKLTNNRFANAVFMMGTFLNKVTFGQNPLNTKTANSGYSTQPDGWLMKLSDPFSSGATLSFRAPAFQSTNHPDDEFTGLGQASAATDGITNPNWDNRHCTRTNTQTTPWWYVDLGIEQIVGSVKIYNRGDYQPWGPPSQFSQVEVRVGNEITVNGKENPICQEDISLGAYGVGLYECGMRGRYVVVRIADIYRVDDAVLSICEVEVFVGYSKEGCSSAPTGRPVNVTDYMYWSDPDFVGNSGELCRFVCKQSKYYGVPATLEDDLENGFCYCDMDPPTTEEAAQNTTTCDETKLYSIELREEVTMGPPPSPNPPPPPSPPIPRPPSPPPPPPSPPPNPPHAAAELNFTWINALLGLALSIILFSTIVGFTIHKRFKSMKDPFLWKRDKAHDPDDPEQEILSENIEANPFWKNKSWLDKTYIPGKQRNEGLLGGMLKLGELGLDAMAYAAHETARLAAETTDNLVERSNSSLVKMNAIRRGPRRSTSIDGEEGNQPRLSTVKTLRRSYYEDDDEEQSPYLRQDPTDLKDVALVEK